MRVGGTAWYEYDTGGEDYSKCEVVPFLAGFEFQTYTLPV